MSCLIIKVTGQIEYIDAFEVKDKLTTNNYRLVELYDYNEEEIICLYADVTSNEGFNQYEFEYENYRGDVIVIRYNQENSNIVDISIEEFELSYSQEYILEDEEGETTETDTYDYSDSFIEDDR